MRYRPVTIGPDVIDLWRWPLDVIAGELPRLVEALSDAEFARAGRLLRERDRLHFLVGRGRLREILARYLGIPAKRLVFAYNAFGKPRLAGAKPPLHFNLSHSGGMAVLAVSDRYQVGVDIEQMAPLKEDVAGHFFSPAERQALSALPPGSYLEAFYRCWTRKEAFVKAHGAGLSLPLDAFDVSIGDSSEPKLLRLEGDPGAPLRWRLAEVAMPYGFVGSVAASTGGNRISLRYRSIVDDHDGEWPEPLRPLRRPPPLADDQLFNRASRM